MSSRFAVATSVALACLSAVFTGCNSSPRQPEQMVLSADALASSNGIATNGIGTNGIGTNGIGTNGIGTNGIGTNGIGTNGIGTNGIGTNGIGTNGIGTNGIGTNGLEPGAGTSGLASIGLTQAALASPEFEAWFALSPSYSDMVMRYVARCALAEGVTLSFDHDGATYAWTGVFGVAPQWAAGEAIGAAEQELVSACLAAHTNGLGQHVEISVRGYLADGSAIATTEAELADWKYAEGCFIGNLFDGTGVGSGVEPDLGDAAISTPRGCSYEFGQLGNCAPMVQLGRCADFCDKGPDGQTYSVCHAGRWVDGVFVPRDFRPLQVFLSDASVYRCGDGVCQSVTENATTCPVDCPPPPPPVVCGDAVCDATESAESCPGDCAPPPTEPDATLTSQSCPDCE